MHDLEAIARQAGRLRGQSAEGAERACPATVRPAPDPVEAAFENELAVWLAQLYTARAEQQLVRVCRIGWLALMAATLAVPLLGAAAALAAMGVLVTTVVLALRATDSGTESLDSVQPTAVPGTPGQGVRPVFGPDERAQLVRLMNLSRVAGRRAARPVLQAELREARSYAAFARWKPLQDLEGVLRADPFAFSAWSQ